MNGMQAEQTRKALFAHHPEQTLIGNQTVIELEEIRMLEALIVYARGFIVIAFAVSAAPGRQNEELLFRRIVKRVKAGKTGNHNLLAL